MSLKPLLFEQEARAELEDAAAWYEGQQVGLGVRFFGAVDRAVEHLRRFPGSGAPVSLVPEALGARRVPVQGFPFRVIYLETASALRVLAIAHIRRKPAYWLERTRPL